MRLHPATFSFRRPIVVASGIAMGLVGRPLFASEDENGSDGAIEEVLVVDEADGNPTEMSLETEQLLSVAGAANDPLQAIYAFPGVTFSSGDGLTRSEPVIRGSAPQDNAYFIDLIPVSYIFHLFGNSMLDKYTINSFDLYPAAFPSQYGNATGGVIDVTLREPRDQGFTTTLHTSLLTAGGMVESRIGDSQSLYATYRRSTMDLLVEEQDVNDNEDEGFQIDELPISDDYQLKYRWAIDESNSLSVIAAGASDSLAATFDETHEVAARDPDFAGPAALSQGFDSQGVIWNRDGEGRELTTIISHISERRDLIYGRDQHGKTDSDRYLARFFYSQAFGESHLASMGLSLEEIDYELDFGAKIVACNDLDPDCPTVDAAYVFYNDTLDVSAQEFYLEDQWSLGDRNSLTFGFHYRDDDYLGDGRIEPRIRFERRINERLSTYVAAGQYSQLPELREMIDVLGNPNLETVKSDHYVWGISQTLAGEWQWSTDVYYKDMTDIVISSGLDATAQNYSNGAEGSAHGVELLIRKDLTEHWYGWGSLSLSESDRTNTTTGETVQFEYDRPFLLNIIGNRLIGDYWMIGFRWSYQSGGRYTPIVDLVPSTNYPSVLEPVYGEWNSEQYADYHRLDFRAEYTRPQTWGYWRLYADVLNVYNQENVSSYEYAPSGRDLIWPPSGYGRDVPVTQRTGIGFFPSIGFEVQF